MKSTKDDNKETMKTLPSFLHVCSKWDILPSVPFQEQLTILVGYLYFFPTFLAGPVFEYKDYVRWVEVGVKQELEKTTGKFHTGILLE